MKRNALIDYLRLVFSFIVMFYHFYNSGKAGLFKSGRFGVEYFVILAGFLFYFAWMKNKQHPSGEWRRKYLWKRYKFFFLYTFVVFLVEFVIIRICIGQLSVKGIIKALSGDIWEILLVKFFGFNRGKGLLNEPTWTLGCMLFAEFLISGALLYWEKPFLTLIMPVSVIFGTAYWINMEAASIHLFLGLFTFGMLRVYLLTCFGIFSYWIHERLKKIHFSKAGRYLLTILELLGYLACVLISLFTNSRNFQFCFILIILICISLSFSGATYSQVLWKNSKGSRFCAELSLCIYLIHNCTLRVYTNIYPDKNVMYTHWLGYLVVSVAASMAYLYLMRFLMKKFFPFIKDKARALMLE